MDIFIHTSSSTNVTSKEVAFTMCSTLRIIYIKTFLGPSSFLVLHFKVCCILFHCVALKKITLKVKENFIICLSWFPKDCIKKKTLLWCSQNKAFISVASLNSSAEKHIFRWKQIYAKSTHRVYTICIDGAHHSFTQPQPEPQPHLHPMDWLARLSLTCACVKVFLQLLFCRRVRTWSQALRYCYFFIIPVLVLVDFME